MKLKALILALSVMFSASGFAVIKTEQLPTYNAAPLISDFNAEREYHLRSINGFLARQGGLDRVKKDAANGDASAQFTMYRIFRYGIAHRVDYKMAASLLKQAADQNLATARFDLGMFYMGYHDEHPSSSVIATLLAQELDEGVDGYGLGYGMIETAALTGNDQAMYVVALHHLTGTYVHEYDLDLAMFWLSRASDKGNLSAQDVRMGLMSNIDIYADFNDAQLRVKQGQIGALVDLAMFYYRGLIVQRDVDKARTLLAEATKLGHVEAKSLLDRL
ncbi:tetratricopeptide repeat protein [Vibrio breoganii]